MGLGCVETLQFSTIRVIRYRFFACRNSAPELNGPKTDLISTPQRDDVVVKGAGPGLQPVAGHITTAVRLAPR